MTLRFSGPRTKSRWALASTGVGLLIVIVAGLAYATAGDSPFDAQDGNFRLIDTDDNAATLNSNWGTDTKDWESFTDCTGGNVTGCIIRKIDQTPGNQDDSFTAGAKEDSEPTSANVSAGSIPPQKSDLDEFYIVTEKVSAKDFLYIGWTRFNSLGTANLDFEFNQSDALISGTSLHPRSGGDMLVTFDFSSGGSNVNLGLLRWQDGSTEWNEPCYDANAAPCWGDFLDLDASGSAVGSVNSSVVDPFRSNKPGYDVYNTIAGKMQPPQTFGEAKIDLQGAGVFPPGECVNFGGVYAKSRSSDAFRSEMKDFIAPADVDVSNCGGLTVVKDADPNDAQNFAFTVTGPSSYSTSFSLDDDSDATLSNSNTLSDIFAGDYYITETTVASWTLTSISCPGATVVYGRFDTSTPPVFGNGGTIDFDPGDTTAKVTIAAEQSATCTFTNKKDATLTITKVTDPANSGTDTFGFTTTGQNGFTLDTNGSATNPDSKTFTYAGTNYGSKTITEATTTGWTLTDISCGSETDTGSLANRNAIVSVDPGDAITCTFTNKKNAKLTIVKSTAPADSGASTFGFTTSGTGVSGFTLDTNAANTANDYQKVFDFLGTNYGSKTITEGTTTGWTLTNLVCSETGADLTNRRATVSVDPGDDITCTFTNTLKYRIIVLVCDEANLELVRSTFDLDGTGGTYDPRDTLATPPTLSGTTTAGLQAYLCGLDSGRYTDLSPGTYSGASAIIPKAP